MKNVLKNSNKEIDEDTMYKEIETIMNIKFNQCNKSVSDVRLEMQWLLLKVLILEKKIEVLIQLKI